MWNLKKCNKLVNTTKNKQTHRCREQTSGYRAGGAGGNVRVGEWQVETTGCKIGSRYCTMWGI